MRNKKNVIMICLAFFSIAIYAQRIDKQEIFVATTEKEAFEIFNQMLDSARVSNPFLIRGHVVRFSFGFSGQINNNDTVMKFVQACEERTRGFICDRFYRVHISNSMPIDFYERFLDHLRQLDVIENYFIKSYLNRLLIPIMRIIRRQYESSELNEQDSIKARQLIEETLLRLINNAHSFVALRSFHEFVTDTVRHALINVLENPFFPTKYLEFYMSHQDTLHLDTVGIPNDVKEIARREQLHLVTEESWDDFWRFSRFLYFEQLGQEWGGLSAGEAYLERRRREFRQRGLIDVRGIARYAYEHNDELLIKHLKKFRERFPNFPLEHF